MAFQARRCILCGLPPCFRLNPELACARYNYMKQKLQITSDSQLQRLVRVQINAPVRPGSLYKCPPREKSPDPCAKDVVLKALSQCPKGKRKFEEPLWFEAPKPKRRKANPQGRPSAFQPVMRNGTTTPFVPVPGPVSRSVYSVASSTQRRKANLGVPATLPLAFPVHCPICRRSHASPGTAVMALSGEPGAAAAQPLLSQESSPASQHTCPVSS